MTAAKVASGLLLVAIAFLFGWSLWPLFGAILWSVVIAILFAPLNSRMLAIVGGRRSLAALISLVIVTACVVLPIVLLGLFLFDQVRLIYLGISTGTIDIAATFASVQAGSPRWISALFRRLGVTDLDSLREQLSVGVTDRLQSLTANILSIGQSAASFLLSLAVASYLTFFLLKNGASHSRQIGATIPLPAWQRTVIADRFVAVVRATVKGGIVVGAAQGLLGGVIMTALRVPNAPLWAVVMALASLLPAVGTGLVWVPVSFYLLSIDEPWRAAAMALGGLFVIGSIDNVLRPILIGRDIKLPDALVLVTTLGGLASFGFNGLLIGPLSAALFITMWQTVFGTSEPARSG